MLNQNKNRVKKVTDIIGESSNDAEMIKSINSENPETDFSGFYSSLVPYSDVMTLLMIFFVYFFLVRDTEMGWKNVNQDQNKKLVENNQVAIDSTEYSEISDLNEKVISLPGEILFESGAAELKWNSHKTLLKIADNIQETISDGQEWNIRIEGHTDNIPISNSQYASNWELSTARALSIVKFFLRNNYFSADQLQIMGYGEFKPLVLNDTPENRRKNRRVEIKLSRTKGN